MVNTSKYLITQAVTRAGFYEDGPMEISVTKAVTIKLETQRSMRLGTIVEILLDRDEYEYNKLSWDGRIMMSAVLLQSPPDSIGYMGDNIFQIAMTTYLGQPCPIMAPVVGRYFGKKGAQVDRYGANLAAVSLLEISPMDIIVRV